MRRQAERVRKAENRTVSELVRGALRRYFESRFSEVTPTRAELAAIRRGRAEIPEGRFATLPRTLNEPASPRCTTRAKKTGKNRR